MKRQRFGPLLALTLMVGCAPGPDGPGEPSDSFEGVPADATELEPADINPNGTSLNGTSLNGTSLNGTNLTGVTLNSVSLSGVTIGGVAVSGVTLSATNFSGTKSGSAISGAGFVNAIFIGTLSNSSTLKLRIDSRNQLTGSNTDVYSYDVSYETTGGWKPLCGSTDVESVPVNGTWDQRQGVTGGGNFAPDSTRFTFACRQHAVAKCVELGYKPWKTVGGTLLKDHHLACVRMIRADYCGDGKSWTADGTTINVYDNKGVQSDTQSWTVEADWTPAGARYVTTTTRRRYLQLGSTAPSCIATKASSSAGNTGNWASGTLIMNEY